jgi:Domain of unknown function (DUF3425)
MPNAPRNVSSRRTEKSRIELQQKLTVNVNPLLAKQARIKGLTPVLGQRQKANLLSLKAKPRGIPELRPSLPLPTTEFISAGLNYHNLTTDGVSYQAGNGPLFHNCIAPSSPQDFNIQIESQGRFEWPDSNDTSSAPVSPSISNSMSNSGAPGFSPTLPPSIGTGELRNTAEDSTYTSNQNSFQNQDTEPQVLTEELFPCSTHEEDFRYIPEQESTSPSRSQLLEVGSMPSILSNPLLDQSVKDVTSLVPACPAAADPYANYLQLWRGSAWTASLYIAMSLNLNVEFIRSSDWNSPFYRTTTLGDDPATLLATAQVPYAPTNLQPTLPQILFPHHAYLDLIPFPVFRARAITLANTAHGPCCDLLDLKRDINAGLVCWSPGNGTDGGNVQPWDVRSWKAAPWFLKKWRMLIE